jgi:hypothetical protein
MLVRYRFILPGRAIGAILGILSFLLSCLPLAAQSRTDFDCRTASKICRINIANQNTSKDEKTAGPKIIIVTGANTLRYDYVFSSTITFSNTSPIDLSALGFVTKTPTPDAKAKADTQNKKTGATKATARLKNMANTLDFTAETFASMGDVDLDPTITEVFTDNERDLEALENAVNGVVQAANDSGQKVNLAALDMRALLLNSDGILRTGGDIALKRQIEERRLIGVCPPAPSSAFQSGLCASWPATQNLDDLVNQAKALQNRVRQKQAEATHGLAVDEAQLSLLSFKDADEPTVSTQNKKRAAANSRQQDLSKKQNDMSLWITRRDVYSAVKSQTEDQAARLDEILKKLADLGAGGKSNTDFQTAQQDLRNWNERMIPLSQAENPFTLRLPHKASCGFSFAGSKTNKVELIQTDLLPPALVVKEPSSSSSSTKVTPASPKTIPVITVECSSPFVMSAGVAFSSITERDFVIQKGADGQNHFATDAHSNFHPLPLAMVNMRYKEFNRRLALYGSFGVAANIKNQSAGGSDPEYLFTPFTFGFFRTAFISPGLHIGREVRLGSNFHEGDVVPASITTPPLQKSYKMGFGIAVTFTKP